MVTNLPTEPANQADADVWHEDELTPWATAVRDALASGTGLPIFDAKGDIIAATAADTAARLAVGSNGKLLRANSAAASGLEWTDLVAATKTLRGYYGVNPSGTAASQTTAIQAALDDHVNWGWLIFDGDGFEITGSALSLPASLGKRITGVSNEQTIIQQATNNVPVFQLNGNNHSHTLEDLHLTYASQQDSSQTSAAALAYTGTTGDTIYWCALSRVRFSNMYWGFDVQGSGNLSPWGWRMDNLKFDHFSGGAINWASPTAAGLPVSTCSHIEIINNGSTYDNTQPVIASSGGYLEFHGLDIEDCVTHALEAVGGGRITVHGIHVERHEWNIAGARLFLATDHSGINIYGGSIQGTSNPSGGGAADFFDLFNTSWAIAEGIDWLITVSGGTVEFVTAAGTAFVYLRRNFALSGSGTVNYPSSVSGAIKQVI